MATPAKAAVDRATARRLEMAEELAGVAVAEAHRRHVLGSRAEVLKVAGGSAVFVEPESPISQCIGCGVLGRVTDADIARIEDFYWSRGNVSQVVVSCAFAPELQQALDDRGYQIIEENLGFFRPLSGANAPAGPRGYLIRAVAPAELHAWAAMQAQSFLHDYPELGDHTATFELFASCEGYRSYIAVEQATGEWAAGGAMAVVPEGEVICLAGAATTPAHRRRGLQAALLARRLADAAASGCDLAYVSTLPGTASHRNVERAGFVEAYRRVVMTKGKPA